MLGEECAVWSRGVGFAVMAQLSWCGLKFRQPILTQSHVRLQVSGADLKMSSLAVAFALTPLMSRTGQPEGNDTFP